MLLCLSDAEDHPGEVLPIDGGDAALPEQDHALPKITSGVEKPSFLGTRSRRSLPFWGQDPGTRSRDKIQGQNHALPKITPFGGAARKENTLGQG